VFAEEDKYTIFQKICYIFVSELSLNKIGFK